MSVNEVVGSPTTGARAIAKRRSATNRSRLRAALQAAARLPLTTTSARCWAAALAGYAGLVAVVSVIPTVPVPQVSHLDKLIHVWEYLVFAWLLTQVIRHNGLREPDYRWLAWIFAVSYGLLLEVIQAMLPWRSAEWADVLSNALGAALGLWVGERIPRQRPATPDPSTRAPAEG